MPLCLVLKCCRRGLDHGRRPACSGRCSPDLLKALAGLDRGGPTVNGGCIAFALGVTFFMQVARKSLFNHSIDRREWFHEPFATHEFLKCSFVPRRELALVLSELGSEETTGLFTTSCFCCARVPWFAAVVTSISPLSRDMRALLAIGISSIADSKDGVVGCILDEISGSSRSWMCWLGRRQISSCME